MIKQKMSSTVVKISLVIVCVLLFIMSSLFVAARVGQTQASTTALLHGQSEPFVLIGEQMPCDSLQGCLEVDFVWKKISNKVTTLNLQKIWKPTSEDSGEWVIVNSLYLPESQVNVAVDDEYSSGRVDEDEDLISISTEDCSVFEDLPIDFTLLYPSVPFVDYRSTFCENLNSDGKRRYSKRSDGVSVMGVILHYTAGHSTRGALRAWEGDRKASAHYIIEKNGEITYSVDEYFKAWHAGCRYEDDPDCERLKGNSGTIGIELVNLGYLCKSDCVSVDGKEWEKFPPAQMESLYKLSAYLSYNYDLEIDYDTYLGHGDVKPGNVDPGSAFDWGEFMEKTQEEKDDIIIT